MKILKILKMLIVTKPRKHNPRLFIIQTYLFIISSANRSNA